MKKKNKHGGKRKGAGRPPSDDPKIGVTIYPRKSKVKSLGGYKRTRKLAENYLGY